MFLWIKEKEFAISDSTREISQKSEVRAVVSTCKIRAPQNFYKKGIEVRELEFKNNFLTSAREFIMYTRFLYHVSFPFVIYAPKGDITPYILSVLYREAQGVTMGEAVRSVQRKTHRMFTQEEIDTLESLTNHFELLQLSGLLEKFYITNEFVKVLRHQCPWDREQTHSSLIPELIEEPLELVEEIKRGNDHGVMEEIGDVLLQVLLHCIIADEEGKFTMEDVLDGLYEKMYERHPHVFGKSKVNKSKEVLLQWEEIKRKNSNGKAPSIAKILAGFITAFDIQEYARKEGFDFANVEQIETKIIEELKELKEAMSKHKGIVDEIGDLLFSVINLSRFLGVDPAHALFLSMDKFRVRFEKMKEMNPDLKILSEQNLDTIWEEIKRNEKL